MKILTKLREKPLPLVENGFAPPTGCAAAPEKLITLKAAAGALGLPVWKLRRAVAAGEIPSYTLLNTRRYVKLSEVVAAIEASCQGGAE
jgi:hypothetical protein